MYLPSMLQKPEVERLVCLMQSVSLFPALNKATHLQRWVCERVLGRQRPPVAHTDMVISIFQGAAACVLLLWFVRVTNGIPDPTQRDQLMRQEASRQTGGQVTLTAAEQKLDAYLHQLKEQEMSAAQFPPAIHFFKAKPLIQKSSIFKLLQKMPKGDGAAMNMRGSVFPFILQLHCMRKLQ